MVDHDDEFYVGYGPAAPRGVARHVRRVVSGLAALAIVLPLALVAAQSASAPAAFEYGTTRHFRGTLRETPVPMLVVERPGAASPGVEPVSRFPLVGAGKHGARDEVRGRDGQAVELAGTLVYRDGHTLIEIVPGSIVVAGGPVTGAATHAVGDATAGPDEDLGPVRLRGEIVDTKCHLGVMNPGDGKVHRGCAARCISGGVPPALRVREASGETRYFLLVGRDGEAIQREVLPFVAEPVEIAGRAHRHGDLFVLYADPAAIRRVGEEG